MRNHTPAPWSVGSHPNGDQEILNGEDGNILATVHGDDSDPECWPVTANANLIAAAPNLLTACEEFVRKVEHGEARSVASYTQMKAAIAKAKGEQ